MAECLFCNLIADPKPGFLVHSTPEVVAFRDIHPQAPTHILVIPRKHFSDLTAMAGQTELIAKMHAAALSLAKENGIEDGFRIVMNCKERGGQTVMHVHLHLLGGKKMSPGLTGA